MKIHRYKRVQRLLGFYRNNYKLRGPFQILVDGTFCLAALENKVNLREQVPKYLDETVTFVTSPCVLHELETLGGSVYGALLIAKQYQLIKCKHNNHRKSASDCMVSLVRKGIKNQSRYFVGTQDRELTEKLRNIPGCPILFVKYRTVLLEKPSQFSCDKAKSTVAKKINFEGTQKTSLVSLKKNVLGIEEKVKIGRKRKRGPKGVNPLSCKKKKPKLSPKTNSENEGKRKRRRNKKQTTTE